MFCSACGQQNDDDARFCVACGKPQNPLQATAPNASVSAQPEGQPQPAQSSSPTLETAAPPPRRPVRRRILKWGGIGCGSLIAVFVLLLVIGIIAGSGDDSPTSSSESVEEPTRPVARLTPTPAPAPTRTFAELKAESSRLSYDDLFRNNERHLGKTVWYEAQVIQVQDTGSNEFVLRANVNQGEFYWDDAVYLYYSGPRLLEDDLIEFVGVVSGLKTYQAVFGNSVTIPEISVLAARLLE